MESEYSECGIGKDKNGLYVYKDEPVRAYQDEMLGRMQIRDIGTVDITVNRDHLGQIISVTAWHKGESEFDKRSQEFGLNDSVLTAGSGASATIIQATEETSHNIGKH